MFQLIAELLFYGVFYFSDKGGRQEHVLCPGSWPTYPKGLHFVQIDFVAMSCSAKEWRHQKLEDPRNEEGESLRRERTAGWLPDVVTAQAKISTGRTGAPFEMALEGCRSP